MKKNPFARYTEVDRRALLDLLILAMYIDGHLAHVEDVRLRRILDTMGFATEFDRNREFDAAVTRVRPHVENRERARSYAADLAHRFGSVEERRFVLDALDEFMKCDSAISAEEMRLLALVKELFSV